MSSTPQRTASGSHGGSGQSKVGGRPLQSLGELFAGRKEEIGALLDLLTRPDNGMRAVNICGGQTGKSALAYQVMTQHQEAGDSLVYLHAQMSIDEVFEAINSVLPDYLQSTRKGWFASQLGAAELGKFLFKGLNKQHVLILFDDMDSDLDRNGQIRDPELRHFIELFLMQDQTARLLITSRRPILFDSKPGRHIASFPLEFGLSVPDGVEMLRKCDRRGILLKTNPVVLEQLVRKVQGLPQLLLAVYSLIALSARRISPEAIAANEDRLYQEALKRMVGEAQTIFSENAQRVM